MRRAILVGVVVALLVPGPKAFAQTASVDPGSGPAGSTVTVTATGYTPDYVIEVHLGTVEGPLLGSAVANTSGTAQVSVAIPFGLEPGDYVLMVCLTGNGIQCGDEFSSPVSTSFTVTTPATTVTSPATTVTTTDSTGTTATTEPPAAGCAIPSWATVIDFDGFSPSPDLLYEDAVADGPLPSGRLQQEFLDAGYAIYLSQWDSTTYQLLADPPTRDLPAVLLGGPQSPQWLMVANNPAGDLTTSPPNVLRLLLPGRWTYVGHWGDQVPDYFGFTVGFGHLDFGQFAPTAGHELPDEIVVRLTVRAMPINLPDGSILDQGAWDSVTVTLGPGPQPVTTCIEARNTLGEVHPYTVYTILIDVEWPEGGPPYLPIDIDDFYYGTFSPVTGPVVFEAPPGIDLPGSVPLTLPSTTTIPAPEGGEPLPPWVWYGLAAAGGIVVGVLLTLARVRRPGV